MQVFSLSRLQLADKHFHGFTLFQEPHKLAADPQFPQHQRDISHLQIIQTITITMQDARG